MSFIVILIALALQFFLKIYSVPHQVEWVGSYCEWMQKRFDMLSKGHGLFGVFILIAPVVIIASLLFSLAYHLLGYPGYLILSLALVWYCLDLSKLTSNDADRDTLFVGLYRSVFACLFWYFIFGPIGLMLYVTTWKLQEFLSQQSDNHPDLQKYMAITLAVLDWVPVRLLGLSFALVGHFGAVFKEWVGSLTQGLTTDLKYLVVWGAAALSDGNEDDVSGVTQLNARALLVWLVGMALVSMGLWFG